jgi:hypothetical protein
MSSLSKQLDSLFKRFTLSNFLFAGNFGVSKIAAYAAPLVIASIASPQLYGALELSLAVGLQIASLVMGSQLSGVTQAYLVNNDNRVKDILFAVAAAASGGALTIFFGLHAAGANVEAMMVAAAFSFAVVQNVGSTWLRMHGARNTTTWVDSAGLLLSGSVVLLAVGLGASDQMMTVVWACVAFAAIVFVVSTAGLLATQNRGFWQRLLNFSKLGFPMMVAGTIGIWVGVGGRIMVGITNPSDLAPYSLAFRIAGVALGVHQLAMTAAFSKIYRARTRQADKIISSYMILVLALTIGICIVGPLVIAHFKIPALDHDGRSLFLRLIPLCGLHTFLWIGLAMLQLRLNRANLAKASILPTLIVTVGGAGLIYLCDLWLSLDVVAIAWMIAAQAGLYVLAAWMTLARRGLPHLKVGILSLAGAAVLVMIAVLEGLLF